MSARIPTQHKSPFEIDPRPLDEMASPHAGLLATSRALRSLKIPDLVEANLKLKKRDRGCSDSQYIESIVLLQTVGGDCPEDMSLIAGDDCLERGLGYALPRTGAVRAFLNRFHDQEIELARPAREVQKSFIMPSSKPVQGLQSVLAGGVRRTAKLYADQGQALRIATVDQDATIIESHKENALTHYEGGRGYQPMVAVWAEADLVLADEFRDGNVPAQQEPLTCARLAFAALPDTIQERYFRGDSACHENDLLGWLKHPDREKEPGGRIGFAVSARMCDQLAKAIVQVPPADWKTFATEADGTLRQWAEVDFVPGEPGEKKNSKPLRYVGLRLLKPQGLLFNDGSDRHHHVVLTNLLTWDGAKLLNWHREKAGTVEHVHDEIKNALAGGHMPSQHFAVNAAWFKLALLSYNLASAIKGLCFSPEERTARFKKYRLLLIHLAGRMSRFQCKLRLRFRAGKEAIARIQKVWSVFALPTQATAFT
ncbi:MAG TPA: IS1380 family transposase [Terriglobales bacterium]|nr:IS1380 family transposase [Terriglobales bacterium]